MMRCWWTALLLMIIFFTFFFFLLTYIYDWRRRRRRLASSSLLFRLPFYNHNSSNANYSRFFWKKRRGRKKGRKNKNIGNCYYCYIGCHRELNSTTKGENERERESVCVEKKRKKEREIMIIWRFDNEQRTLNRKIENESKKRAWMH